MRFGVRSLFLLTAAVAFCVWCVASLHLPVWIAVLFLSTFSLGIGLGHFVIKPAIKRR